MKSPARRSSTGSRSQGCPAASLRRRQGRPGWGSVTSRCCKGCCAPAALRARSFHMLRIEDAADTSDRPRRHRRGAQSFRLARRSGRQPRGPGHGDAARDQPARHRRSGAARPRIRPPARSRLRRRIEAPVPDCGAGPRRHLVHAIRSRRRGRAARQSGDDRQGGRHLCDFVRPSIGQRPGAGWESRGRWYSRSAVCSGARASR